MSFLTNKGEINLILQKQKSYKKAWLSYLGYMYKSSIFEINRHKIMKMILLVFEIIQLVGMDVGNFLFRVWTSHSSQGCFQRF
jgi:DNA-binding ferritin-like protein (Dps family)